MRRGLLAAFLVSAALPAARAQETFPSRPVQLAVPYPPGGNTDLMARALQPELAAALGQPVVVTNRGGAAGTIGTAEIARARPDGHAIGLVPNNPLTAQPHLTSTGYDLGAFRLVCLVYDNPQVLVAGRGAPFRDGRGMLEHARSAPEALVLGSPGQGSTQHILAADLLRRAGARPLHVPYTGAGPMGQAALAGQIHAFVESPSIPAATGLPVLAVFSAQRLPSLPEVPTVAELGHPVQGTSAGGLVAPAGIPEAAFGRLQAACERAVGSEAFRAAAERLNAVPRFLPGEAFRARFAAESEANRGLLRALDLARD